MAVRKIVKIDEEKCNGCGQCVPNCVEGALRIVDGKARMIKESYCDGLGACLGTCPQDAITIEEREAAQFDEAAVAAQAPDNEKSTAANDAVRPGSRQAAVAPGTKTHEHISGGCPGSRMMQFHKGVSTTKDPGETTAAQSELGHWPVQIALVPLEASFYENAELVLAADCAAYAVADFHQRFLKGRALAIACPKLDDMQPYVAKLAEILRRNTIRGLVIVHMEVPCCGGLGWLARQAIEASGRALPVRDVTISVRGEVLADQISIIGNK